MCVLLLFNDTEQLTYKEIAEATEIPGTELKRALQSLSLIKGKNVLRKEPLGKDVSDDDKFIFNRAFTSKFFKVKISTVAASKEGESEKAETRHKVEEDRKPEIEAAIVRIMKARKTLDHNSIITEVTRQLSGRFLPNPAVIKKRIESLIEREFLARDEDDRRIRAASGGGIAIDCVFRAWHSGLTCMFITYLNRRQLPLWLGHTQMAKAGTLEEEVAEVSMKRHGHAQQLVVFFGAATIGTGGGWGADAVLRACCKVVCRPRGTCQHRGRVVLVDEHRTSRVSSAVNGQQPCEAELDKLSATRPAGWKPPEGQVEPRLQARNTASAPQPPAVPMTAAPKNTTSSLAHPWRFMDNSAIS
ncbi:CULLIN_2 domain-containing protein [Haematococcus lacustris]|uniref:CULLIN_2 domain-containing protein n=1 Tax=Haematococcus lacustris TaxID=44745 RepID=A0A6A0A2T6_HAELA|nr:CULLIN_2 domain-containing protein [Haematococcus lacustris]